MRTGLLILLLVVSGCRDSVKKPDASAEVAQRAKIVEQTKNYIDSLAAKTNTIAKLANASSGAEISQTLQQLTAGITEWKPKYFMLRAQMIGKGIDDMDVEAYYQAAAKNVVEAFNQVEIKLRTRSDISAFDKDLERAHDKIYFLAF